MPCLMENINKKDALGDMIRFWRKVNRISQMDLALDVSISSRHLSFVETGKSQPSRKLILKMAHSLKLPLRHRNALLNAAGYASAFGEAPFDGQKMEIIRQALRRMLEKHEPYPALVVNTAYDILMTNSGFDKIINIFLGEDAKGKYDNVYRLTFARDGLRQYIVDWPVIGHFLMSRLWEEALSTQNEALLALHKEIAGSGTVEEPIDMQTDNSMPIMSLTLEKDSMRTSFFTTITTLGTPLDLTTQELRIESLFPADEQTKQSFQHQIESS